MANLRTSMLLGAAALIVSVSACQKYEGDKGDKPAAAMADTGAVTDAIKADEKAWNDQFDAKDLNSLAGRYAADAFFIVPGMKGMSGSADIRKGYEEALKDPNFAVDFSSDKIDVAASGDVAYSRGHFTEKYTDPKTKQVASNSGSYITVYRKQDDGSWKVVEDFTAVEPAEAPAPAAPVQ